MSFGKDGLKAICNPYRAARSGQHVTEIFKWTTENLPRNRWKLARVDHTYPDNDGLTRKVRIAVAGDSVDNRGRRTKPVTYLDRPIQKLFLLLPADLSEDREIPIEEPDK